MECEDMIGPRELPVGATMTPAQLDLVTDWCDALRSGSYRQGQGSLQSLDGCYCALGVLADLINPHWGDLDTTVAEHDFRVWMHPITGEEICGAITDFNHWTGLGDIDYQIAVWNDDDDLSFHEIADRVEYLLMVSR